MGTHAARTGTLSTLTLLVVLACGGRSLTSGNGFVDGAAGGESSAGASSSAGAPPAWNECVNDEDCELYQSGCCPPVEPVDASQLVALRQQYIAYYGESHCEGSYQCSNEPVVTEYEATRKYFRAICDHGAPLPDGNGICAILDVRGTSYTRCASDSDCALRDSADCCSDCDGHGWVPANRSANFCSSQVDCPSCDSAPAKSLGVNCKAGFCAFAPSLR